jgi:hypothetical protein
MAMLLGIETMPVKVAIRHQLWQKTREAFLNETGIRASTAGPPPTSGPEGSDRQDKKSCGLDRGEGAPRGRAPEPAAHVAELSRSVAAGSRSNPRPSGSAHPPAQSGAHEAPPAPCAPPRDPPRDLRPPEAGPPLPRAVHQGHGPAGVPRGAAPLPHRRDPALRQQFPRLRHRQERPFRRPAGIPQRPQPEGLGRPVRHEGCGGDPALPDPASHQPLGPVRAQVSLEPFRAPCRRRPVRAAWWSRARALHLPPRPPRPGDLVLPRHPDPAVHHRPAGPGNGDLRPSTTSSRKPA